MNAWNDQRCYRHLHWKRPNFRELRQKFLEEMINEGRYRDSRTDDVRRVNTTSDFVSQRDDKVASAFRTVRNRLHTFEYFSWFDWWKKHRWTRTHADSYSYIIEKGDSTIYPWSQSLKEPLSRCVPYRYPTRFEKLLKRNLRAQGRFIFFPIVYIHA